MSKYIDTDKLIERLEEMKRAEYENCGGVNSKTGALQEVQELIDSLQQEQPEEMNEDFFFDEVLKVYDDNDKYPPRSEEGLTMLEIIARHFYELGKSNQYQKDREEFAKLKAKEWQSGYDEGCAKGLNARKEK